MPPFRNLLGRKSQPSVHAGLDENYLSPNPPAPIPIRNSQDGEPTEYKLSGMAPSTVVAEMQSDKSNTYNYLCSGQ
jgi:hypothetical protein